MNRLTRISATVASSLALVAGFSGIASASNYSIDGTGRNSDNTIEVTRTVKTKVNNTNNVFVSNDNSQVAASGNASVLLSERVDDVRTGDASNDNDTNATVHVDNSSSAEMAAHVASHAANWGHDSNYSIRDTGNNSDNKIEVKSKVHTQVTNNNTVTVENTNSQAAVSGDATVVLSERVSDVSTGNATNSNASSFEVHVSN